MANHRTLSAEDAEDLAETASTLVDAAVAQRDNCEAVLRKLETALNAVDRGATQLTRDIPNKIAQQAAQEVVRSIADLVTQKVAEVLQPAEAEARTLLREIKDAAADYRRAKRDAVLTCIIASALVVLVVIAVMKMFGVV
jgi:hypothetical protein